MKLGDSPWSIAKGGTGKGARWPELVNANPQKHRGLNGNFVILLPDELLTIPPGWNLPTQAATEAGAVDPSPKALDVASYVNRFGERKPWWDDNAIRDLLAMCERLGMNPADFLLVSLSESDMRPDAFNPSGARGLNQLMPANASAAGVSPEDFKTKYLHMTVREQLPFVERYYKNTGRTRPYPSAASVYEATFAPALMARGDDPSTVLYRAPVDRSLLVLWNRIAAAGFLGRIEGETGAQHRARVAAHLGETEDRVRAAFAEPYPPNQGLDHGRKGTITLGDLGLRVQGLLDSPGRRRDSYFAVLDRVNRLAAPALASAGEPLFKPVIFASIGEAASKLPGAGGAAVALLGFAALAALAYAAATS